MAQRPKSAVMVVGGIVAGMLIGVGVVGLLGSSPDDIRLGDDEFRAGRVDSLAAVVARDGPVLFGDLVGADRPLYVVHEGSSERRGWRAVAAIAPGSPADCVLEWDGDGEADDGTRGVFVDPCSGAVFGPGSRVLEEYPSRIDGDHLYVDLNAHARATSTTSP